MSIILDALRKSDAERQRQSGPGLADAGYRPPPRRRSLWLPLLVIVLAGNLLLGAYLLWRDRPPSTAGTAPATTRVEPPAVPAATTPVTRPQQIELLREDAPYQPMADLPALESEAPGAADTPVTPPVTPPPATVEPAVGEPPPASAAIREGPPTIEQLAARGELALPPLHVDIHVYSEVPAERFVFINQRKYTEGSQLSEGPRVEEITQEGAILSQGGQRFLLTRD